MKEEIVYMKLDRNTKVDKKTVYLLDVAKIYCANKQIEEQVRQLVLFKVPFDQQENYMFSIMKVLELINHANPNIQLCNLGETDFIVEYNPPSKPKPIVEYLKVVIVCFIVFFGAAFTIMTFNEDASVKDVFSYIYQMVLGKEQTNSYLLELSYAIGLPIGTIVFFNHFAKAKLDKDPTPLQIQMRLHEEDINTTMIENANREGNTIDID